MATNPMESGPVSDDRRDKLGRIIDSDTAGLAADQAVPFEADKAEYFAELETLSQGLVLPNKEMSASEFITTTNNLKRYAEVCAKIALMIGAQNRSEGVVMDQDLEAHPNSPQE
jgi:hypothetical protein